MSEKPYRIRVRVLDGKPRSQKDLNKLKSNILGMAHLDIFDAKGGVELIVCASQEKHLADVRAKLHHAGLEEIEGGDTSVPAAARPMPQQGSRQDMSQDRGRRERSKRQQPGSAQGSSEEPPPDLRKKPYGFVRLPERFTTAEPVWHDGTSSAGRLSGEIRFELETLTPLLVGWERFQINHPDNPWPVLTCKVDDREREAFIQESARTLFPDVANADPKKQEKLEKDRQRYITHTKSRIIKLELMKVGLTIESKSVLCPLRAPWDKRPVIIPGDTLKGLLRHELGALLGAPMERVAERSYSYRPNAMFPDKTERRFLVPRLARVPPDGVKLMPLCGDHQARVPTKLELFPATLEYNKKDYRFDDRNGAPYRGGQGAGEKLNSKRNLHKTLAANPNATVETVDVPETVQQGYLATIRHLADLAHGHFSERHPDVPNVVKSDDARNRILKAAKDEVFQPGDMIWVEWDTERECIVSFGWHYYYRWAYVDTVRRDADAPNGERRGLFPLPDERAQDGDGAPRALSPVRRLFGYTGDNEGSAGIGKGDYEQLMGRVSINAALEVVGECETDDQRFLPPTFLKELGMPRPSAVEFYLKQPYHPHARPSDRATLVTYGDAAGYDEPGELAGRKFYLDRSDAYTGEPWKDDSAANRANERSTLALEASKPGRKFRFTLRFRDLEPAELAAVLIALCPHQFREVLGGAHPDGYCSKLGYARPLGWGSVRTEAKALLFLELANNGPQLRAEQDIVAWVRQHYQATEMQAAWLDIHRHKHPDAADYPKAKDKKDNENIYTFHTDLRAKHSRLRRYKKEE